MKKTTSKSKAKNSAAVTAVFFDIGATLADPVRNSDGTLQTFNALPGVAAALRRMSRAGLTLGIISDTGAFDTASVRTALSAAGLLQFFPKELVFLSGDVHLDKSSPLIFRLASERAHVRPDKCLFVGDDPSERRMARLAGMRTSRAVESARLLLGRAQLFALPDLSGKAACMADARRAVRDKRAGPREPNNYKKLLGRLETTKLSLPPLYRERFAEPFIAKVLALGADGFRELLKRDRKREEEAGLMFDLAQAILQNGDKYLEAETDAYEEVVSDLYDGFLSAEDRAGIKKPDTHVLAPLVKWGDPRSGPYTWPIDSAASFNVGSAVVSLPPANARRGLLGWTLLSHETAGHDILHADRGLQAEYARKVFWALHEAKIGAGLDDYWSDRIDETASDVMGILNMGPAAAIGLVVYFRGWNAVGGKAKLSNTGYTDDPHPADILRGFLAASTVRLLSFAGATDWANMIERETEKDVTQIRIGRIPISLNRAKRSCEIVASTLATARMDALNQHSLIDIQNWRDEDEAIVEVLQKKLRAKASAGSARDEGIYAAHVVAAAALAALAGKATVKASFDWMKGVLKTMHDSNASWGPLFVIHPGNIARDFIRTPRRRRR